MALPKDIINKIRHKVRQVVGTDVDPNTFFTFDRDTQQIVTSRKIDGWHFIFDNKGNLIKQHRESEYFEARKGEHDERQRQSEQRQREYEERKRRQEAERARRHEEWIERKKEQISKLESMIDSLNKSVKRDRQIISSLYEKVNRINPGKRADDIRRSLHERIKGVETKSNDKYSKISSIRISISRLYDEINR